VTVLNCDDCNANADKIRCLSMREPKRRPSLNFREYLGPVIVGSVALFSLLVTNQLVWRAFNSLSARISGPFIWVTPDPSIVQTKDGPPHALQGNVYFQLVAPPGSQVRTNQDYLPGPSIMITSRIGRTSFGFHLHRGSNKVGFMLGGDVASPVGIGRRLSSTTHPILYHLCSWLRGESGDRYMYWGSPSRIQL